MIKNNRKFEQESVTHKEFVGFIRELSDENGAELSDELLDVIAELPLEEILI